MSLSKTLDHLLSTGSTQKDLSQHNWKYVDLALKNQCKQTNKPTVQEEMHLQAHTLYDHELRIKVTQTVAQYPLYHMA